MDLPTASAVIATATAAVTLFDKVAGQVVRFISKSPSEPGPPKEHSFKLSGDGKGSLKVESHGHEVQVITGADLKKLPSDYLQHIKTLEASMRNHYDLWSAVYPDRDESVDLLANAKTRKQLEKLALAMKDDLTGIIDFLQSIGVHLDDHYMVFRDVIGRYDGS